MEQGIDAMPRRAVLALGILALLFAGAIMLALFCPRAEAPRISLNAVDENAVDPLRTEMACIDGVISNHQLNANEVQPRLDACRGSSSGNSAAAR